MVKATRKSLKEVLESVKVLIAYLRLEILSDNISNDVKIEYNDLRELLVEHLREFVELYERWSFKLAEETALDLTLCPKCNHLVVNEFDKEIVHCNYCGAEVRFK